MASDILTFDEILAEAKAGNAWPPGEYDFEIVEATSVHSKDGVPMINAKLRALVGNFAGKIVRNNFVLSLGRTDPTKGSTANMFLSQMETLGVSQARMRELLASGLDVSRPDCLEPIARAIIGQRCRVELDNRPWQGVMQNNVKRIKPITGNLAGGPATSGLSAMTGTGVPPQVGVPANYGNPMSQQIDGGSPNFQPLPPLPQQPQAAQPVAPQQPPAGPPPAPVPTPAPAPTPQPTAPPAPAPAPEPAPAQQAEQIPPGFEAVWPTLSEEARTTIRAQFGASLPAPAPAGVPAPPTMPI